jgi:hypothetical protein
LAFKSIGYLKLIYIVRKIFKLKSLVGVMVLPSVDVNWVTIIIATVVSFFFGWVWYGPLFGKAWLKGSGMSPKEAKKMHKEGMGGKMVWNLIGTAVTVYVLANVLTWAGVTAVADVFMLSLYLGVGFMGATTLLGEVLWKGRPWSFYLINLGYWILNLEIMGYVLVTLG